MKKPQVTRVQERRIRGEGGGEERKRYDVRTVSGRTSPRATW